MERNILYSYNIDQRAVYENGWDLSNDHLAIFAFITHFTASRNSIKIFEGSDTWTWISHKLILEQMPLIKIKERRLQDYIKDLQACKLIELNPKNQSLGRTYIRLGENYDTYKGGIVKVKNSENQNSAKTNRSTQNIADKETSYNLEDNNPQNLINTSAIIADSTQNIADPLGKILLTPSAENCVPPTQNIADYNKIQFTTNTIEKVNNLKTDDENEISVFDFYKKGLLSDSDFLLTLKKQYNLSKTEILKKLERFVNRNQASKKVWTDQNDFNMNFFDYIPKFKERKEENPDPLVINAIPEKPTPEREQLEKIFKQRVIEFGEKLKTNATVLEHARQKFNKECNYPFEFNSQAIYNHINDYITFASNDVSRVPTEGLNISAINFEGSFIRWFKKQRHNKDLFSNVPNPFHSAPELQKN